MASDYDSAYQEAKRLMLCFKDREDTQKRLAELVPLLLEEIDRIEEEACYAQHN